MCWVKTSTIFASLRYNSSLKGLSWMDTLEARHDDVIGWFEHVSENASKVQSETLRRILELNSGVEYLRKWLGTVDVEEIDDYTLETLFSSSVPIVSHADLDPYIQRIADGETSPLLTQEPITVLSLRYISLNISICIFGFLCVYMWYLFCIDPFLLLFLTQLWNNRRETKVCSVYSP